MDRKVAELLMKHLQAVSAPLNAATQATSQIADKNEQAELRRGIGKVVGRIYTDLMMPIIKQYPDLQPDYVPPHDDI